MSAWHEGVPPRIAARITYSVDVTRTERVVLTAAGADEIGAAVRRWLKEVEAAAAAGDGPVTEE